MVATFASKGLLILRKAGASVVGLQHLAAREGLTNKPSHRLGIPIKITPLGLAGGVVDSGRQLACASVRLEPVLHAHSEELSHRGVAHGDIVVVVAVVTTVQEGALGQRVGGSNAPTFLVGVIQGAATF